MKRGHGLRYWGSIDLPIVTLTVKTAHKQKPAGVEKPLQPMTCEFTEHRCRSMHHRCVTAITLTKYTHAPGFEQNEMSRTKTRCVTSF